MLTGGWLRARLPGGVGLVEKVPAGLRDAEHRPSQGKADCVWKKP